MASNYFEIVWLRCSLPIAWLLATISLQWWGKKKKSSFYPFPNTATKKENKIRYIAIFTEEEEEEEEEKEEVMK